jgi:hypothetical protein
LTAVLDRPFESSQSRNVEFEPDLAARLEQKGTGFFIGSKDDNLSQHNNTCQMKTSFLFVVILGAVAMPHEASAGVIYGDIAGNTTFSGYGVGPGGGVNNDIAEGFLMTGSYDLQSVDVSLSQFETSAGSDIALSIFSNNAGVPDIDLYDLSTSINIPLSGSPAQVNLAGTGSFVLNAGSTYWLEMYATNPSSQTGTTAQWDGAVAFSTLAIVTPTGPGATEVGQRRTFSGGTSNTELRTAIQLNGVLVPEPSSMVLAAFGLVGLVACGVRSHRRWADRAVARLGNPPFSPLDSQPSDPLPNC